MTPKLSCIRDKCILYPICKQREVIQCIKVEEYITQCRIFKVGNKKMQRNLLEVFPEATSVRMQCRIKGNAHKYLILRNKRLLESWNKR